MAVFTALNMTTSTDIRVRFRRNWKKGFFTFKTGPWLDCTWEHHGREGTDSPGTAILIVNGKRYTPYARKLWNIEANPYDGVKSIYKDFDMSSLVYKDNPFLALIPKKEFFYGETVPYNPESKGKSHVR